MYALMRHGVGYVKQAERVYAKQTRQKVEKQFYRRASELGFEVTKIDPPPSAAPADTARTPAV